MAAFSGKRARIDSNSVQLYQVNLSPSVPPEVASALKDYSQNLSVASSQSNFIPLSYFNHYIEEPKPKEDPFPSCFKCSKPLRNDTKNVLLNGNLIHAECFVCHACGELLKASFEQKDGNPYCKKDYDRLFPKEYDPLTEVEFKLTQPAEYQVANYNVHPPPCISCTTVLESNYTVYAVLKEEASQRTIAGGFQSGDVRVLRAGQTTLYFTGLKLNKMGPIKNELNMKSSKQLSQDFCIEFKIGSVSVLSEPFKIVSSCSQVPDNVRDSVRPMKKEKSLDKKRKREEMLAHVNQTQLAKQLQGRTSLMNAEVVATTPQGPEMTWQTIEIEESDEDASSSDTSNTSSAPVVHTTSINLSPSNTNKTPSEDNNKSKGLSILADVTEKGNADVQQFASDSVNTDGGQSGILIRCNEIIEMYD